MTRMSLLGVGLVAVLAGVGLSAQSLSVELQRITQQATVTGDLRAAIEGYKQVVARAGADRAVAAQALLRMAACYEKLGASEARTVYERVVREYADQKEAVVAAQARLASERGPARQVGDRAVWTGLDVDLFGTISPDGRFLTYTDWEKTNNVMLRDLVAGTSRPLTNNVSYGSAGYSGWSVISRNGEQVAYGWQPAPDGASELRIASLRGSSVPSSTRVLQSQGKDTIRPFDWSPDGRWIAVLVERDDRSSQLGLVSVQEGTFRQLKSIDWRGVNKAVFSPDGRFIAYDLSVGDTRDQVHVFVMAVDGSRETAVVEDHSKNHLMGWSPGGHLLFASDRSGSMSLWAVPVEHGRSQAAPTLVKANIGSSWSLGLTPSGTLYTWKYAGATYVRVAPIDMDAGTVVNWTTSTFQRFVESRGRPDWSADGRHLVYTSCGPTGGGPCTLSIRSTETGVVREVPHRLGYLAFARLAPDGHAIVTNGGDLKGRRGIYLIDSQTGETSLLVPWDDATRAFNADWSSDGKSIRYQQTDRRNADGPDRDAVILERHVESGATREIFRTPAAAGSNLHLSPDGSLVGHITKDPASHTSALVVTPIAGGATRPLLSATDPEEIHWLWKWTPDGHAVVARKNIPGGGNDQLWLAPLTGPQRLLDIDMGHWAWEGFLEFHPDGRQVAFVGSAGAPGAEVWALENFLPALNAKNAASKQH